MRYVVEGIWSGYTSSQERVVHRAVINAKDVSKYPSRIGYTDGTLLYVSIRPAKPNEKVKEIHGYDSLIDDCVRYGVSSVCDLMKAKKEALCDCEAKGNMSKPKQHGADPHAKNCRVYST